MLALAATLGLAHEASAASVGVFGSDRFSAFLNANGHTSSSVSLTTAGLSGLDVLILNRRSGNAAVVDFVNDGDLLITEWSASQWALNTANLLNATDTGGGFIGSGTQISFTAKGQQSNLDDQSGPSYCSPLGGTDFFRNFSNIGAGVEVLPTRPGGNAVILAGSHGAGQVLIMGYDWQDDASRGGFSGAVDTGNEKILLRAVDYGPNIAAVPLPAGLPLMLAGMGALGWVARHRTNT